MGQTGGAATPFWEIDYPCVLSSVFGPHIYIFSYDFPLCIERAPPVYLLSHQFSTRWHLVFATQSVSFNSNITSSPLKVVSYVMELPFHPPQKQLPFYLSVVTLSPLFHFIVSHDEGHLEILLAGKKKKSGNFFCSLKKM